MGPIVYPPPPLVPAATRKVDVFSVEYVVDSTATGST